jgi:hypothetical protein
MHYSQLKSQKNETYKLDILILREKYTIYSYIKYYINFFSIIFYMNQNDTNILDQIASYNSNTLESYIYSLKRELKEQKELNNLLKNEDYEGNIKKIKDFISINDSQIDDQMKRLITIITEIKGVVNENKILEKTEDRYDELLNSPEANSVANKLREIKKMKESINHFLLEEGIIIPLS